MKLFYLSVLTVLIAANSFAHDGGHGPVVKDTGKHGGLVAAVVLDSEVGKTNKLIYKSELIRLGNGVIKVYLYDTHMKPLALNAFEAKASGVVEYKKRKQLHELPFAMTKEGNAFTGKAPKSPKKPYGIDIRVKEGGKTLLMAFENLD